MRDEEVRVAQLKSASRTDGHPEVLIETKLHPPVARKEWVERPELIKYLADAEAKLILVAAPPGFGKTTLVAQWRASPVNHKPFAWVSLDRADNDPTTACRGHCRPGQGRPMRTVCD